MPQHRKDEVERRILRAARSVFAREGFRAATMAGMAREAGVATGNLYRYFEDKRALFDAALPAELPTRLLGLLVARVRAVRGVRRPDRLPAGSAYHAVAEELLAFALRHRHEVVFLFARADGSPHAGFDERVVQLLQELVTEHFRGVAPGRVAEPATRLVLRLVYLNLVRSMVAILEECPTDAAVRAAVASYTRYHQGGLKHLFG